MSASAEPDIFDDEDAVIMPAIEPLTYAPKAKTPADMRAKIAEKRRLEFRRTMIPVLLTASLISFFFAVIKFLLGPDSPLTALPVWVPIVLFLAGSTLLAFAAINMFSVRAELARIDDPK